MAETSNPILAAAQKGDWDELLALIQQHMATLDAALNSEGHTALHVAAQYGHLEVVKALVDKGANVDAGTESSGTPLMLAALKGHVEVAAALRAAHASVNAVVARGVTLLHAAVASGSVPMMEVLLDAGASVDTGIDSGITSLHLAAQMGLLQAVSVLLAKGATVDLPDSSGRTALQFAAEAGHLEVVQQLFLAGAAVNAVYEGGGTALHAASARGHLGVVQLLLASGADPAITDDDGLTPLYYAVECRKIGCVEVLLEAGADPDKLYAAGAGSADGPFLEGDTALHRAVAGRFAAAVPLLATPANMWHLWQGKTPLHLALSSVDRLDWFRHAFSATGDMDVGDSMYSTIQALLDAGSPAGVPDADGDTALTLAARSGDVLLVGLMPAMVRTECQRYKQLLEAEERGGQQGGRQQDAGTVRAGIVDGLYALLAAAAAAAAAAASKDGPAEASPAEEGGAASPGSRNQPAPQADDPPAPAEGDPPAPPGGEIPSAAAAFGDLLADPKWAVECLEVVLEELGTAEAGSMFQHLLLKALASGEAAAGSAFHLLVDGLLHSVGWPEVGQQLQGRWAAADRLRGLLGQPVPQVEQLSDGSQTDQMPGLRAQALAAAAAGENGHLLGLLDQLAGLQMAEDLPAELEQGQGGGQAVEAGEGMWELLEALNRAWGAAQQEVLCQMQQEVADAVLSGVMAWDQAGGRDDCPPACGSVSQAVGRGDSAVM